MFFVQYIIPIIFRLYAAIQPYNETIGEQCAYLGIWTQPNDVKIVALQDKCTDRVIESYTDLNFYGTWFNSTDTTKYLPYEDAVWRSDKVNNKSITKVLK